MATGRSTSERSPFLPTAVVVALTAAIYLSACFLPAGTFGEMDGGALADGPYEPPRPMPGWFYLAFGWIAIPLGSLAWTSNFVLAAGMVFALLGRQRRAARLGLTAALLSSLALIGWVKDAYIGFYLWLGCQWFFAIGMMQIRRSYRPREQTSGPVESRPTISAEMLAESARGS